MSLVSSPLEAMVHDAGSFDLIIDTVRADHALDAVDALMGRMALDGTRRLVGAPRDLHQIAAFGAILPEPHSRGLLHRRHA